jgi:alkanesulfonate monooxygenase SsuD/methylene tetrahydromethanopterin reductase-like flavin-dependent oxidoreductase (luciferase family)
MKLGLTVPNRGVLFGVTTPEQMLQMAELADRSGRFQSVWVGDSLLGKPRMEAIALLAGIAARTRRVRIGAACMASIALRDPVLLAYQWASLDLLAGGRTIMVGCTGIVSQEGGRTEASLYHVTNKDRAGRLVEWLTILKRLWTEDHVTFEGEHYRFADVTIEPKPVAKPRPPIWLASNSLGSRAIVERTHRRVAEHAEGWETSLSDPEELRWRVQDIKTKTAEAGRDPDALEFHLYHNVNLNDDQPAAWEESKRFLDIYYAMDFPTQRVRSWTAAGSVDQCVEHLRVFEALGFHEVTLRITGWDQFGQLHRVMTELAPRLLG